MSGTNRTDEDLVPRTLELLATTDGELLSNEAFPGFAFVTVKSALDRLGSREVIRYKQIDREEAILSEEAEGIAANGSHEARVFEVVAAAMDGLKIADLPTKVGKEVAKIGQGKAFKEGWIKKDKDTLRTNVDKVTDTTREQLLIIQSTRTHPDPKVLNDLRKRKLITLSKVVTFSFSKGPNFTTTFQKEETDLTADMLASGAWKDVKLKPYNFKAKGAEQDSGALHPLNKVRQEFRQIFFEMGFEEMPTNRYVESGFWNFDALFVPQQHPARDLQDTFYISDPSEADLPQSSTPADAPSISSSNNHGSSPKPNSHSTSAPTPSEYLTSIHRVHQDGAFSSLGYRYPFSTSETRRLLLRTHTTAVSTSMLYHLAQNPHPARYFSIDRVFRNETVDATHLAEFHQVEGVIADYNLTLGGLIGFMEVFFEKMGIRNLRFKPAYNPYTEPSLEIFSYHPGLRKTVEIGNSGMFRPEMLEPMGLPKDMRVFGWGLSLERPTMIKYGVSNIRELLGHKVDLGFVRRNAAVRLEKE